MNLSLRHAWTIAARELGDAVRDRGTMATGAFFVIVMPIILVVLSIRPIANEAAGTGPDALDAADALEALIPVFLMQVGLLPLFIGVNVIATAFAGERETGTLGPLVATPVSTEAIFVGKLIAAAIPAFVAAVAAMLAYLGAIVLVTGTDTLDYLDVGDSLALALLVFLSLFVLLGLELIVASRVATVRAAQQYGALAGLPLFFGLMFWAFKVRDFGPVLIAATMIAAALAATLALIAGAKTWRREEAIARI
jgi:ABC-2 type transport system permease protein